MTMTQEAAANRLQSLIPAVSPQELSQPDGEDGMDPSSRLLRDLEWQHYLRQRREHYREPQRVRSGITLGAPASPPDDLAGIALSGGGIRSATFALGVMQALAHHDLLRRFDYLSTVSGGGYIGTSLTWLTSRLVAGAGKERKAAPAQPRRTAPPFPAGGFGLGPSADANAKPPAAEPEPFPYGSEDPRTAREPDGERAESAMLRYLRQHGYYLTPGKGITLTSIIVILLRGIILNLLVWIPIFAALMWFLIWLSVPQLPDWLMPWVPFPLAELGRWIYPGQWMPAPVIGFVGALSPPLTWGAEDSPKLFAFGFMLAAALALFAACVAAFVGYSLATYSIHQDGSWLGGTKYTWRRGFERRMRWLLWITGTLLLLGSVPFATGGLHGWVLGSSFSLIGLVSGLMAFVKSAQPPRSGAASAGGAVIPGSWIASIGAAFLLYGVLLVSFAFGWWAAKGEAGLVVSGVVLFLAVLVAGLTGWFVDLNLITIHRFYRDRLMEAFLPDVDNALHNETAPAMAADSARLSSMCDPQQPVGPYHIINANLVLTESDERSYRLRGGDSFVLSSLYCGSNATGWRRTDEFVEDELTVPTAMAISGAAANPWTASGGVGVTRNPLVGMLMALMNLRLGFWLPNPGDTSRCKKRFRANHFNPGLKEVVGGNLREDSPVCLLSDGGHFENLGLYELVRRRVRLIVLCDGTADPDYAFADLQNAMARVWADFGARIEFDKETTLRRFMPSIDAVYPRDVRLSECAYAVAQIIYADGRTTGHLVYLTTALCRGARLKLLGYKGANRDFPDQSTADQFFDEEQFEAYRELGYDIADGFIQHDMRNGGMLGQSIRTRLHLQTTA
jgi:Patatin-like phospholipase